jgi:predicted transcriptional regulator
METITLTVDKSLLEEAQKVAEEQQVTREAVLNEWLHRSLGAERVRKYDQLMERLKYVNAGRKFTREEMNERR